MQTLSWIHATSTLERRDLTFQKSLRVHGFVPEQQVFVLQWAFTEASATRRISQRSVHFSSVAQSCLTLRPDPADCSMPGFPVHHQLPEFTQPHVHRVGDAIQPSHPLLSPSPFAFNLSQHQGLFQWVNSSPQVAQVLEFHFSISTSNEE